jgi:hypothetical protein
VSLSYCHNSRKALKFSLSGLKAFFVDWLNKASSISISRIVILSDIGYIIIKGFSVRPFIGPKNADLRKTAFFSLIVVAIVSSTAFLAGILKPSLAKIYLNAIQHLFIFSSRLLSSNIFINPFKKFCQHSRFSFLTI